MKRILTAVVLIAIVLGVIFFGNSIALSILACLIALLAAYEYAELTRVGGAGVPVWWLLPAIVLLFAQSHFLPLEGPLPLLSFLGLSLFTFAAFFYARTGKLGMVLPTTAEGFFGLIYVGYPLMLLPMFAAKENGKTLLVFLMLVVWTGDIAALYIGKSFGKHKLAPALSPNKTWEGAIASVAGSMVIAGILVAVCQAVGRRGTTILHITEPLWQTLLLALLVNTAAQIGDLVESAIKRGVGVKDSGTLLPGHGGVLDRIDALLVAAPVLWYLLLLKDSAGLGGF